MPGSIAETVYGRRGGGYVPKETKSRSAAEEPKDRSSVECKVCGQKYRDHSGTLCRSCGAPIEHHKTIEATDECWAGRARMALAKREAGTEVYRYTLPDGTVGFERRPAPLNEVEREALRRIGAA